MDAISSRRNLLTRAADRLEELLSQSSDPKREMLDLIQTLELNNLLNCNPRLDNPAEFVMDAIEENAAFKEIVGPHLQETKQSPEAAQTVAAWISLMLPSDNHLE